MTADIDAEPLVLDRPRDAADLRVLSSTVGCAPRRASTYTAVRPAEPAPTIPFEKCQEASERIHGIFSAADAEEAYRIAARSWVDYLPLGEPEREASDLGARLLSRPDLFRRMFHAAAVSIFCLERAR